MSNVSKHERVTKRARPIACRDCDLNELCRLAVLIAHHDGRDSRTAVGTWRTIERGAALFRTGDAANGLFAVRQGMIKSVHLTEDGHERIVAFHTPGEVIGVEAFRADAYICDAIAVEPSLCCELPLPEHGAQSPHAHSVLTSIVRLLSTAAPLTAPLTRGSARERVTRFLFDLSTRLQKRGMNGRHFKLPMSRTEIANILDTRVETVSRTLQQLHREGAICVRGSTVELLDLTLLSEAAR